MGGLLLVLSAALYLGLEGKRTADAPSPFRSLKAKLNPDYYMPEVRGQARQMARASHWGTLLALVGFALVLAAGALSAT